MAADWHGKYINLDRCRDRRGRMDRIVSEAGLGPKIRRHAAAEPSVGIGHMPASVLGCLRSHVDVVRSFADVDKHLLVLEDDVFLAPGFLRGIQVCGEHLETHAVDIMFLGQTIPYRAIGLHAELLRLLARLRARAPLEGSLAYLDCRRAYRYGCFAYMINRKSLAKVDALLQGVSDDASLRPIDVLYAALLAGGKLTGNVVFPYLVGLDAALESTMKGRSLAEEHAASARLVNIYVDGAPVEDRRDSLEANIKSISDAETMFLADELLRRLLAPRGAGGAR
jgi:hypothetical protein